MKRNCILSFSKESQRRFKKFVKSVKYFYPHWYIELTINSLPDQDEAIKKVKAFCRFFSNKKFYALHTFRRPLLIWEKEFYNDYEKFIILTNANIKWSEELFDNASRAVWKFLTSDRHTSKSYKIIKYADIYWYKRFLTINSELAPDIFCHSSSGRWWGAINKTDYKI